jgi:GNAT superfamily N-acetyltransferase
MNTKGLTHWNNTFPGNELIKKDLQEGCIFLAKEKGVCKGMITISECEPEDYRQLNIASQNSRPLYLHRIAVHPLWQGKGIARQMIEFARQRAKETGFNCIRLDVFKPSARAIALCVKNDFKEIGSFQAEYQRIPFVCYEKQL